MKKTTSNTTPKFRRFCKQCRKSRHVHIIDGSIICPHCTSSRNTTLTSYRSKGSQNKAGIIYRIKSNKIELTGTQASLARDLDCTPSAINMLIKGKIKKVKDFTLSE